VGRRWSRLARGLSDPVGDRICIFVGVMTAVWNVMAVKRVLERRFPHAEIYGLFVARRVPKSAADAFDVVDLE